MPRTTTPQITNVRALARTDEQPDADYEIGADEVEAPDDEFYSLDDAITHLNVLYYGREGTGKTTDAAALANLPDSGRVLIINAEGGTRKGALARRGIDTGNIVLWPRPGTPVTFDGLARLHQRLLADLMDDPKSWSGVVFDSLTEIAAALREQATQTRQSRLTSQGRPYDPNFIDVADYGVQTDQLRRVLRRFRDLPCHFIATALERENDEGQVGPDLGPALANSVAGYVDVILYTRATQSTAEDDDQAAHEFRALTRPTAKYRAKDRYDLLPRVLAEPSIDRVIAYIEGELTEDEDALQADYLQRVSEREANEAAAKQAKTEARAERRSRTTK